MKTFFLKISLTIIFFLPLSATDIFLFGDSMAEAVAKPLEKKFKDNNVSYNYIFRRGTQINYWIDNPLLYLEFFKKTPNIVLISLGTNDLVAQKTNQKIIEHFNTLIDEIISFGVVKDNIFLIATPIQNDNELNNEMEKIFQLQVIKSKELLLELKEDKIHPTIVSNKIWSENIFNYITKVYESRE